MNTVLKTIFTDTTDGEQLRMVTTLLDYKEGDTIILGVTLSPGTATRIAYEVIERLDDEITLYGHEVIREYRICQK